MSDITQVKRALQDRAQSVAEHLLPNGTKQGNEWKVGSIAGEPGESLSVRLSGPKAGRWCDFANPDVDHGDLLDLWCRVCGLALPDALDAARSYLGMERPEPTREPKKAFKTPAKPSCGKPKARVRDYLVEERNIPAEVLDAYRVSEEGENIIFPFLLPDATPVLVKRRKASDGATPAPTEADCQPILFGWQAVPDSARTLVITEGEIDALSLAAYGYNAVSVPFGGGSGAKQQWIEHDFERLERFETVYLALDMDDPGEKACDEIANRIGRHRCVRVSLPAKDANECLVNGEVQATIDAAFEKAQPLDPEGLKRPKDFVDEVTRLFWPSEDEHVGYRMPYRSVGDKIVFRPAELTLWSGASGSGKSQILSDCQVDWVQQGSRFCLASLEMKPGQTLKRMVKQVTNTDRPTHEAICKAVEYLDDGLILYERVGKSNVDGLLEVFDYAKAKYGCDQFIIDSLMRLGIGSEDYEGQEKAVFKIVDWTIRNGVHTHLVAHTRKGDGENVPATEDVKGAMEIGANAFNILAIWRNRKREDDLDQAKTEEDRNEVERKPGVIVNCAKQRNGDFEGKIGMWFHQDTYRYATKEDDPRMERTYIRDIAEAA